MIARHIGNSATHLIKAACLGQCGIIIMSRAAEFNLHILCPLVTVNALVEQSPQF